MCQVTQCFLLKGFFKQNNTLISIETLENVVNTEKKQRKINFLNVHIFQLPVKPRPSVLSGGMYFRRFVLHTSLPPPIFPLCKNDSLHSMSNLGDFLLLRSQDLGPPLPYSLPGESPPFFIRTGLTLLKNPYCHYLEGFPVLKLIPFHFE